MTVHPIAARARVDDILSDMIHAMRLDHWRVDVELGAVDDSGHLLGEGVSDPRSRHVIITIDSDLHDNVKEIGNTLRHELLHVLHASFQTYRRACSHGLKRREDDIVEEVYQLASEETVMGIEAMLDAIGLDAETLAVKGAVLRSARRWPPRQREGKAS